MTGVNTGSITYAFDSLLVGVGGLLNYYPDQPISPAVISIYDATHTLIESTTPSFTTAGIGEFHGFELAAPTIKYFELTGGFVGLRNLTTEQTLAAVPEPETFAMLLAGLGMMGFIARKRVKQ